MKLSFGKRFREDKRFQQAVEDLQREAMFRVMGIDPEAVAAAWNGKELVFDAPFQIGAPAPTVELRSDPVDGPSPVADLDGKAATELIEEAAKERDVSFLQAVFAAETRSTLAMTAARALFDLRSSAIAE